MTASRGLALDRLRKLSNKTMGDGWLSLILEDVTVDDLVSALKTLGAETVWLCREEGRYHDWAEGSPPHCWFLGEGKHHSECGYHVVYGPLPDKEET